MAKKKVYDSVRAVYSKKTAKSNNESGRSHIACSQTTRLRRRELK